MEEKAIKFAAWNLLALTVLFGWLFGKLPEIRVWAEERAEERLAEEELAEETIEMNSLEIKDTEVADQGQMHQLRLTLPEGVSGEEVTVVNDYMNQKILIEIPHTMGSYFDNDPISGSSNHIENIAYLQAKEEDIIEIAMDMVYELETDYDTDYYYFDFLTPQEVYDKVVVIDAGHGGRAVGATKQGICEKDINLAIVLQIKEIMDQNEANIGVYYTRTDDSNPTFDQRVQLANKAEADLFISIHNNSMASGRMSSTSGTQVMYSESDTSEPGSKNLAQICMEEVTEGLGSNNRGLVKGDKIYIIRTSEVPVALIEVGFMTNEEELKLLNSEEYQKKTAEALYHAILRAFEEGY